MSLHTILLPAADAQDLARICRCLAHGCRLRFVRRSPSLANSTLEASVAIPALAVGTKSPLGVNDTTGTRLRARIPLAFRRGSRA